MAASASTFSLGDQDAVLEGSTQLTPTGSLRHSRHSSRRSSKRSSTSEVREGVKGVGVREGVKGVVVMDECEGVDVKGWVKGMV